MVFPIRDLVEVTPNDVVSDCSLDRCSDCCIQLILVVTSGYMCIVTPVVTDRWEHCLFLRGSMTWTNEASAAWFNLRSFALVKDSHSRREMVLRRPCEWHVVTVKAHRIAKCGCKLTHKHCIQ